MASAPGASTTLAAPYDVRDVFAAARGGDAVALTVVEEEARRIAMHIVPLAAVTHLGRRRARARLRLGQPLAADEGGFRLS